MGNRKLSKMCYRQPVLPKSVAVTAVILALLLGCDICEASIKSVVTAAMDVPTSGPAVIGLTCTSRNPYSGFCTWNNGLTSFTNHTLQRRVVNSDTWTNVSCSSDIPQEGCASPSQLNVDHVCYLEIDYMNMNRWVLYRINSTSVLGYTQLTNMTDQPMGFNILRDAYPCPPNNITMHAISSSSVEVFWDRPLGFPLKESKYLQYRIRYNKYHLDAEFTESHVMLISASEACQNNQVSNNCESLKITIDSLSPAYSNVYIEMSASQTVFNEVWSEWSQMLHTRLLEEAPAIAPGNFEFQTEKNDESNNLINVHLSWTPIPENQQNGPIIGYNISVQGREPTGVTDYQRTFFPDQNATDYTITDLNKSYRYTMDILAYNKEGSSPRSTVITIDPTTITAPKSTVISIDPPIIESNLPIVIAVSASFAVCIFMVVLGILLFCLYKKKIASRPVFVVKIPILWKKHNSNLEKPSFRKQEPEHFDDINTAMKGSYIALRDETTDKTTINIYPNHMHDQNYGCQSPSVESSGHGTFSSFGSQDMSGQDITDDEISYHTMSPTGLSPVVKHFPDLTGCETTRLPSGLPVVAEAVSPDNDECVNSNYIHYPTMLGSLKVASDSNENVLDMEDDSVNENSKKIVVALPTMQSNSQIAANGLIGTNGQSNGSIKAPLPFITENVTADNDLAHQPSKENGASDAPLPPGYVTSAQIEHLQPCVNQKDKALKTIVPYVLQSASPLSSCNEKLHSESCATVLPPPNEANKTPLPSIPGNATTDNDLVHQPSKENGASNAPLLSITPGYVTSAQIEHLQPCVNQKNKALEYIVPYVLQSTSPLSSCDEKLHSESCATVQPNEANKAPRPSITRNVTTGNDFVHQPSKENSASDAPLLSINPGLTSAKIENLKRFVKQKDPNGYLTIDQLPNTMPSVEQACPLLETHAKTICESVC